VVRAGEVLDDCGGGGRGREEKVEGCGWRWPTCGLPGGVCGGGIVPRILEADVATNYRTVRHSTGDSWPLKKPQ
jgi:hypothetical protein